MTYRQTYQAFLESVMARGGTPRAMEQAVSEFNAIENSNYQPSPLFEAFVNNVEHKCATCSCPFHALGMATQLDQETICPACLTKESG